MSQRKYKYLYNKNGILTHWKEAIRGDEYSLYPNFPFSFYYKQGTILEYFSIKNEDKNPMHDGGGGGESVEHYNAKMNIAYNKKYYDTVFKKDIFFDNVIPEKSYNSKRPDLSCYVDDKLVMCIEIYRTNSKTADDIEELKKIGVPITEIDINNENKCKHIILPALLEVNRKKYNKLLSEYTGLKGQEGVLNSERIEKIKDRIEQLRDQYNGIIKQSESIYYSVINEHSELKNRIDTIKSENERFTEFENEYRKIEQSKERIYKSIYGTEKRIESINSRIERTINNRRKMEEAFTAIAKDCKIEWFRNKWMTTSCLNKTDELMYWTS